MCTSWIDDGEKTVCILKQYKFYYSLSEGELSGHWLLACVCLEKFFELGPHYPRISGGRIIEKASLHVQSSMYIRQSLS
jgi:hypothetical protein